MIKNLLNCSCYYYYICSTLRIEHMSTSVMSCRSTGDILRAASQCKTRSSVIMYRIETIEFHTSSTEPLENIC